MALRIEDTYTNATPADANYPEGSFKNEGIAGALDGTPFEKAWPNDIYGFLQKLLNAASITPSGAPDTVPASDYYNAMVALTTNTSFRTITISDSLTVSDRLVFVDATAGDVTITPVTAANMVVNGSSIVTTIKRTDTSSNVVTITGIEGDDIELAGTGTPFIKIASNGTTIYLVG